MGRGRGKLGNPVCGFLRRYHARKGMERFGRIPIADLRAGGRRKNENRLYLH